MNEDFLNKQNKLDQLDQDEHQNEKFKMELTDPDSFLGDYSSMRRGMSFVNIKR